MIRSDKLGNALYALHGVLIRARYMAYAPEHQQATADVLDYAEELPRLIATESDMTERYRQSLESLVKEYPAFAFVLERFDQSPPPRDW